MSDEISTVVWKTDIPCFVECRGQWAKNVGLYHKSFIILYPVNLRDTFCFPQVTTYKMSVVLCFIAYVIQKKYIYYLTLCDRSSLNFPADFRDTAIQYGTDSV